MQQTLIKPTQLVKETWKTFRATWDVTIKYSSWIILSAVLSSVLLFIPDANWIFVSFAGIFYLASIAIAIWVSIALYQVIFAIEEQKKIDKKITQGAAKKILPLFLVSVIVGIFVVGGFVALIIPGVYIAIRLAFSQLSFIEKPVYIKKPWIQIVLPHVLLIIALLLGNNYPSDWMRIVVQLAAFLYLGYTYFRLFKTLRNPIDASWKMTQGRFWAILGRQFFGMLCFVPVFLITTFIAVWIVSAISGIDLFAASQMDNPSPIIVGVDNIINSIIQAAFLPLISIFQVKLYQSLKKNAS